MRTARAGFTLIELLVVIGLIMVLGALSIAFLPSLNESDRAARGGSTLQQWLSIAKQLAVRDQAPRGLRFFLVKNPADPNSPVLRVEQCQYIEQPDDFTGGTIQPHPTDPLTMVFGGVDLHQGSINQEEWLVQPGDYLEVLGGGLPHRITEVYTSAVKLASPLPFSFTATTNYRILRAPRVSSDEMLLLPDRVAIDLETNTAFGNLLPPFNAGNASFDILFAPSGAVLTTIPGDFVALWVRDVEDTAGYNAFHGEPTIIALFPRSGLAAAYPPAPPPRD